MTIRSAFDSLTNFVTGLNVPGRDPTASAVFQFTQLNRNQLESMYRSDWVSRKIVDAPAEDATREWRQWQANDNQIEFLKESEKKFDLRRKMKQAIIKARLYGGGAMILGVDQGETYEPLDPEQVGKDDLKFVVVMHRYELSAGPRIYDVNSPWYTRPEYYTIATPISGLSGEITGGTNVVPFGTDRSKQVTSSMVHIHPSRVIEFVGNELPDWHLAPMGGGWGDSVLQTAEDVIRDIGLITGGMANMVNDAKMDVIKIPGFTKNITTDEYANRLLKRFMIANTSKSSINSILLDADEEWNRITTNFSGLPRFLQEFLTVVSGAANIPISRLIGNAPSRGLGGQGSGGGEQDLRNYNDGISSKQENEYEPALMPLDEILIRSTLGSRDPNIHYEWNPLWQMDDKEKAAIHAQKAATTQIYVNLGLINEAALRAATVNQLSEDKVYPGLDDAIEEFGEEPDQPDAPFGYDPATGEPASALPALQQHSKLLAQDPKPIKKKIKAKDSKTFGTGVHAYVADATPRTLYVRRNVTNAKDIVAWAKSQGFKTTVPAEDMHVTIAFSKNPVDWMKIAETNDQSIIVSASSVRMVDQFPGSAAVVLLFNSSILSWRHEQIKRDTGASWDHAEFQPHITITWDAGEVDWQGVEPYRGPIELGPEVFEQIKENWKSTIKKDAAFAR